MGSGSQRPGDRRRFLLELWLEPREVATRILRLRGRIKELPIGERAADAFEDNPARSVASIEDIDAFIHESFEAGSGSRVTWEVEP
jgi:hypothetical protein